MSTPNASPSRAAETAAPRPPRACSCGEACACTAGCDCGPACARGSACDCAPKQSCGCM